MFRRKKKTSKNKKPNKNLIISKEPSHNNGGGIQEKKQSSPPPLPPPLPSSPSVPPPLPSSSSATKEDDDVVVVKESHNEEHSKEEEEINDKEIKNEANKEEEEEGEKQNVELEVNGSKVEAVDTTTTTTSEPKTTKQEQAPPSSTPEPTKKRSPPKNPITFEHQNTLPRLPIPQLESTMERYLTTVRPLLLRQNDVDEAEKQVKEFMEGDGPKLQELLMAYDEEKDDDEDYKHGSYVEEFWSEAYLSPDCSVVLNLNPFFLLEEGPDAKLAKDQIGRASSIVHAAVRLASSLKKEEMKPDVFRGTPLCMDQFKALFGASRIPKENARDDVYLDEESSHVLVMMKNQLYYFRALWPYDNDDDDCAMEVAVDENDIRDILNAIKGDADKIRREDSVQQALGVLTTLPRGSWAVARDEIISCSAHNKAVFEVIDSALFVLCLDDFVPQDVNEAASNMLHGTHKLEPVVVSEEEGGGVDNDQFNFFQAGTCCNRWYDKLQIIVCADGSAGINFEHSAIDGHTALRFASDVYAETVVSFAQSITKLVYGKQHTVVPSVIRNTKTKTKKPSGKNKLDVNPKKLDIDHPISRGLLDKIYHAETKLADQIISTTTCILEFPHFGKTFLIANHLSPDSFVQMSMLLSYYRLYGQTVCTYEPVMTKRFYHGRTEAMRSTTMEAVELCQVFVDERKSKEEKVEALRKATMRHSELVKEASGGRGVDRHLYALRCIAEKNDLPIPSFFTTKSYQTLNHTILSTSNCGNPALRLFGFGPVVPDGFGIGYIIKDSALQYSISSKHRQTERYKWMLYKTLCELGELLKLDCLVEVKEGRRKGKGDSLLSRSYSESHDDVGNKKDYSVSGYDDVYGERNEVLVSSLVKSSSAPADHQHQHQEQQEEEVEHKMIRSTSGKTMGSTNNTGNVSKPKLFARVVRREKSVSFDTFHQAGVDFESNKS